MALLLHRATYRLFTYSQEFGIGWKGVFSIYGGASMALYPALTSNYICNPAISTPLSRGTVSTLRKVFSP
jgi:hypothetical protein